MYWIQDDVAKLMQFVHINKGRVGSTQIVDPESLAEAMQQRSDARGLVPNNPNESLQDPRLDDVHAALIGSEEVYHQNLLYRRPTREAER